MHSTAQVALQVQVLSHGLLRTRSPCKQLAKLHEWPHMCPAPPQVAFLMPRLLLTHRHTAQAHHHAVQ